MKVTQTEMGFTVDTGGMWEESDWTIALNYKIGQYSAAPCQHCGPAQTEIKRRHDGTTYEEKYFICPRVVIAVNEGGYNSTGVCLDCILQANEMIVKGLTVKETVVKED